MKINYLKISFLLIWFLAGCSKNNDLVRVDAGKISVEINNKMQTRVYSQFAGSKPITKGFSESDVIFVNNQRVADFNLISSKRIKSKDKTGWIFKGEHSGNYKIEKILKLTIYKNYPEFIFTNVRYINRGNKSITVNGWISNDYVIPQKDTAEVFWSYQGATYEERPDWVLPVKNGYSRKNYLGMNATDYGGGIPIVDVWKRNYGFAIGHVKKVPKLVSFPVERNSKIGGVEIKMMERKNIKLNTGDSLKILTGFIATHKGDYFHTLKEYSKFMQEYNNVKFNKPPKESYEPIWCAWGYERNFNVKEILGTLPKVKELGYKWVVLDDGWQTAEGDWFLNKKKFPYGDASMKSFVKKIHDAGLKAKLWWAPLAVDPGTKLIKRHPDMLLINKEGKYEDITWWDSYYLCPAYQPTLDYTKKLVDKFIGDWGFDGLKIDGQHLNGVPPCYNPKHHHKYPEESTEALPHFFETIYNEAHKIKQNAVIEVCPCGTAYNYYMLPYLNQVVASDPVSSWQIRLKGKTFKALMGPEAPYYGDHVELSDNKDDFASTIGVGGVIGTKFVWPVGVHLNKESGDVSLTKKKEKIWKKWSKIYSNTELPKGEYLGELYDIGFDKPEAHVIKKGSDFYYAFYAKNYKGEIELRGLSPRNHYVVYDYVNNKKLGEVKGTNPKIKVNFENYLLLKCTPDDLINKQ
jgi:alpha-galactosidase